MIIHQADTVDVCGNSTYTPSPSLSHMLNWSGHIHDRMFYYLLGQAVLSLFILFYTVIGKNIMLILTLLALQVGCPAEIGNRQLVDVTMSTACLCSRQTTQPETLESHCLFTLLCGSLTKTLLQSTVLYCIAFSYTL